MYSPDVASCNHRKQEYLGDRGWRCLVCGAKVPPKPPVDWSDGRAPLVVDDIEPHWNMSQGRYLRSRAHIRDLGLVPVPPITTAKDPDTRRAVAQSLYDHAETKRLAEARARAEKVPLAAWAQRESSMTISGGVVGGIRA